MGDDLDNNNNPSNEGTEPEVQETSVPQQTDPYDPGTYQIGDGRQNLKFVTYDTIEFVKDNGSVADLPIINIVPGEASGTSLIICGNEQEFNNVGNVPDKALAYRTDLNALFVRWQGAWMPVKTTSTQEQEQGTPTFVTPNYAEKDKNETITGTWTFNENTTFKKDISSDTFQSGLNGWRLKDDSLEVENLTVRNKLKTNVFEIDKIKATNGSLYVSSCTTLTYVGNEPEVSLRGAVEPSESPTDVFTGTTYYVTFQEDVFEIGDIIQCHTSNKNYTAIVRASNQIQLEADPVGNPAVEDEVVKINSTVESRNGSILLTSDLDNAPYIEVRKGDTAKVRLGNLSGINGAEGYGLYADNAYLNGTFKLSNGNSLIDASGNNVMTQVGKIDYHDRQIEALGSRITQTERKIESLVVDDGQLGEFSFVITSGLPSGTEYDYVVSSEQYQVFSSDHSFEISCLKDDIINFDYSGEIDSNIGSDYNFYFALFDSSNNTRVSNEVKVTEHGYFVISQNLTEKQLYIAIVHDSQSDFEINDDALSINVYRNGVVSEIRQTADQISMKVSSLEDDIQTGIDITLNNIVATTDNFEIQNQNGDRTFYIDADGNLKSDGQQAAFNGKIVAKSGEFGIFEVGGETGNYIQTKSQDLYFGKNNEVTVNKVQAANGGMSHMYQKGSNNLSNSNTIHFSIDQSELNSMTIAKVNVSYPKWTIYTTENTPYQTVTVSWNIKDPDNTIILSDSETKSNSSQQLNQATTFANDLVLSKVGNYRVDFTVEFGGLGDSESELQTATYGAQIVISINTYSNNGTYITENSIIKKTNNSLVFITDDRTAFTYGDYSLVIDSSGIKGIKNGVITSLLS